MGNSYLSLQDQAKGLLGHGVRILSTSSGAEPEKNECWSCSSPLFRPMGWARLGDGSRWLYYALLTTESKTIWIFKAAVLSSVTSVWFPKCRLLWWWWRSGGNLGTF